MKVLFTSSQETCLENINQLRNFQNNNIKKETEGSFLNQNNVFTYCQYEKTGGINIIDLANVYSCSFIETQDLGRMHKDGSVSILGRFDQAEIRGCNLLTFN